MFIEDFKGTDAYMRKNIKARQEQNGLNHLSFSIQLFKGVLEDEILAAKLL